jgi:hypothetical protein
MVWNHRVIRHEENGEVWYAIHECFYEKPDDDSNLSWTENEIAPIGETVDELRETLERMLKALDKPILTIQGDKLIHE